MTNYENNVKSEGDLKSEEDNETKGPDGLLNLSFVINRCFKIRV